MKLKIIHDFLNQDQSLVTKVRNLWNLIKYYNKLNNGINSGKIYHQTASNPVLNKIIDNLQEDSKLIDLLFHKDVKNFHKTKDLKTHLNFENRVGSNQIGLNSMYIEKPIRGLWTTGKATFYLPTKKGHKFCITIVLQSIPPLRVTIGIEKTDVKKILIQKLSTRKVTMVLSPSEIKDEVCEVFVTTDKLWLPNQIMKGEKSTTLGICVKSIEASYF